MKILTSKGWLRPAERLANSIEEITGEFVRIITSPYNLEEGDKFIRYGNASPIPYYYVEETKYNTPEFIGLCCNKLRFSNVVKSIGIRTPEFFTTTENLIFPMLIRTSLFLSGGRGIIPVKNEDDFYKNFSYEYYWTPFIYSEKEFRVHVLGGKVAKTYEKVPLEKEDELPIRSLKSCRYMSNNDYDSEIQNLVDKLSTIIGTENYYGLDIGICPDGEFVVYENNSAPGIGEMTSKIYAEFFVENL